MISERDRTPRMSVAPDSRACVRYPTGNCVAAASGTTIRPAGNVHRWRIDPAATLRGLAGARPTAPPGAREDRPGSQQAVGIRSFDVVRKVVQAVAGEQDDELGKHHHVFGQPSLERELENRKMVETPYDISPPAWRG